MVDWGTGKYETTAAELEPVAHAVRLVSKERCEK
jgi:hypothetical protein